MPSLLQSVVGLGAVYLVYCIYWEVTIGSKRRAMIREKGCEPPKWYPLTDPIGFGVFRETSLAFKEHRFLELARSRFSKMGVNTYMTRLMGSDAIITIEPENLKTVQALDFKKWKLPTARDWGMMPLLGPGIFTNNGAAWSHSREMLRPNFNRSQVGDLDTFEIHIKQLIDRIPRDGSTFEISHLFYELTLDSATEFLFGHSTNCLSPEASSAENQQFATAFNESLGAVAKFIRQGRIVSALLPDSKFGKDRTAVYTLIDSYVKSGLAKRQHLLDMEKAGSESEESRYVFLNELVKATSDPVAIRSELLNILLAGRDTTASLLSNTFFMLSKRPDIYTKLRAEIDSLDGKRPTFQQLKDLKYLRALLNESLRIHPVVPGNTREAAEDTVLPLGGGKDGKSPLFVPKGTILGWSVYTMHRRKDYYGEDAEEFKPERWLDEVDPMTGETKKGLRPGWEYLPFNGGPRICLGRKFSPRILLLNSTNAFFSFPEQFALTEASYTTVRVLQEFGTLESRDPRPWQELLTLTCTTLRCQVSMQPARKS